MILADYQIETFIRNGRLGVTPYVAENVQPASLDLTLGTKFRIERMGNRELVDPWAPDYSPDKFSYEIELKPEEWFILEPDAFVLATTVETLKLGDDIVGRVDGRSSIGRLGVVVHSTAGFIDPGFCGQITLEMSSASRYPIKLVPGKRICQVSFSVMAVPAMRPYGKDRNSKYQGQTGPQPSKISLDV